MQWKQQFLQWSTIKDSSISVFTADQKEKVSRSPGTSIPHTLINSSVVYWRRWYRRLDLLDGSKSTEAIARLAEDDGLSHIEGVGIRPAGRGARRSCCDVQEGRYDDQGAHEAGIDG
jgi:hypothetical protein